MASKKIYVHYEPSSTAASTGDATASLGPFTIVTLVTPQDAAFKVVDTFVSKYLKAYPEKKGEIENLKFHLLFDEKILPMSSLLFEFVNNKDDLFTTVIKCEAKKMNVPQPQELQQKNEVKSHKIQASEVKAFSAPSTVLSDNDYKEIAEYIKLKSYRKAIERCEFILSTNRNDRRAVTLITKALVAAESSRAVKYADQLVSLSQRNIEAQILLAKAQSLDGDDESAVDTLMNAEAIMSITDPDLNLEFNSTFVEILLKLKSFKEAGERVNAMVPLTGVFEHLPSLLVYSRVALIFNNVKEAVHSLLKAIVIDAKSKSVLHTCALILQSEFAIQEIQNQIPLSNKAFTAYLLLSNVAKDCSCLQASETFLKIAQSLIPASANISLTLAHLLEISQKEEIGLRVCIDYIRSNCSLHPSFNQFIVNAIELSMGFKESVLVEPPEFETIYFESNHNNSKKQLLFPNITSIDPEFVSAVPHDDNNLDALAICFYAIKILFLQGRLKHLPDLISAVELIRRSWPTPLHETTIRNEHAYYLCVSQIICTCYGRVGVVNRLDQREAVETADRPLYLVGDSHCLSAAWRKLVVHNECRIVVPKLVTGLKQWHLRPESVFYPKENFKHVISSIPDKSDVIFLVGEIDCREGLYTAIERYKYDTVEDGMKATIGIFKSVVSDVIKKKKFNVFIHPIAPVLDMTRPLVIKYNEMYRRLFAGVNGVKWIDLLPDLLTDDQLQLKECYSLDGTHLSPEYVPLLEKYLNQL